MTTVQTVGAISSEAAEWYAIDWQAINRNVRRLQVRIVQATKASRWGRVRALQRLLTHSYSGKVLAVRRVTENNGKATPGVDQEIWDTQEKKIQAVHALQRRGYRSQPLRRVYIPKSDGKTMRPLGIPTMKDRAQQALYLLALAPVVETTADKNSYGFRQQRSCADAMEQCFKALRSANTQWILEGDIKSCFDKISHDWLLAHVPIDRAILQKWLKAGYMDKHVLHETTDGTPQGGIISPALANYALDGLERILKDKYPTGALKSFGGLCPSVNFIRYADDFVIGVAREDDARRIMDVLPKRMSKYGLTVHPEKTRLVRFEPHQADDYETEERDPPGPKTFDFLGFTHYWGRSQRGEWVVKRKTANGRLKRALAALSEWCRKNLHAPIKEQHQKLVQKLRGHYGYYGIIGNFYSLQEFREGARGTWRRKLSRRRRDGEVTWAQFLRLEKRYSLPRARVVHGLRNRVAKS